MYEKRGGNGIVTGSGVSFNICSVIHIICTISIFSHLAATTTENTGHIYIVILTRRNDSYLSFIIISDSVWCMRNIVIGLI